MSRWNKSFVLVCLTLTGCGGCGSSTKTDPRTISTPVVVPGPGKGLSRSDRQQFYHLAEGSELFPLAWMRALVSEQTNQPFMEGMDRFGLLPDPDNADELPVGLTAATSRDTRFLDLRMVGVNCAACHVNDLQVGDKKVRINGAPALFDLGGFYGDLLGSALATAKSPTKLFAFLRKLARQPEKNTLTASASPSSRSILARSFNNLDEMRKAGDLEKAAVEALEALVKEESARPALDLRKDLTTKPESAGMTTHAAFTAGPPADTINLWKDKKLGENSPLRKAASQTVIATSILPQWLTEARLVIRLLRSRADFLLKLASLPKSVTAGPSRIDAFGGARNLIFDSKFALPTSEPVNL